MQHLAATPARPAPTSLPAPCPSTPPTSYFAFKSGNASALNTSTVGSAAVDDADVLESPRLVLAPLRPVLPMRVFHE